MGMQRLPVRQSPSLSFTADLDAPLLAWGDRDRFTLSDACRGILVFGGTGSGKTSGSGRLLATTFLSHGFGGLIMCAKPDEAALWERYAASTGRSANIVRVSEGSLWRINFLDYILARFGSQATNLAVAALKLIAEASRMAKSRSSSDGGQFWEDATHQLLIHTLPLLHAAWGRVRLGELYRCIQSAPQTEAQAMDATWQSASFFYETLCKAGESPAHRVGDHTIAACASYWRYDFARLDPKTRANIVITLTSLLSRFSHGRLHDLFCTHTTFVPDLCFEGAIVILDMPVKTWGEDGIVAQQIIKFLWQRAVEARAEGQGGDALRPVFLWADECQFFIADYDKEFQSTARSSRAATVYLTQSLPALQATVGGQHPDHTVNALLNNLTTRIFHANGCSVTNRWAAECIGQRIVMRAGASRSVAEGESHGSSWGESRSTSWNAGSGSSWSHSANGGGSYGGNTSYGRGGGGGTNKGGSSGTSHGTTEGSSFQEQKDYRVDPSVFARLLRTGGAVNGRIVDAIVMQPSARFSFTGDNFTPVSFRQED